jgi:hypothetical protein
MSAHIVRVAVQLPLLFTFLAATAHAQAPAWTVGSGGYYESYSFGDYSATGVRSVSLVSVPFGAALQPAPWLNMTVMGAFATATAVLSDDSRTTVSGFTDTALQLSSPLLAHRFVMAATFVAPTGSTMLSVNEARVAGLVAADLLPFRISSWGRGGAVDVSTSVAASAGGLNLGARIGYQMGREFDLLDEDEFMYRPGNQLHARAGVDGNLGDGRLAAHVTLSRFGSDEVNSQNLYQTGDRMSGIASYSAPLGPRGRAQAYAGVQRRQRGAFLDGSATVPAQTLLMFGAGLRQPVGAGIMTPSADVRLLRSADGIGQGYIGGVGSSWELSLGNTTVLPSARLRLGRLLASEGVETGITGFEIGTAIRFGSLRQ